MLQPGRRRYLNRVTQLRSRGNNAGLTAIGPGSVILSGANTFANNTIVSAGSLVAGVNVTNSVNGPFGNSANPILLNGGSLLGAGGVTVARPIAVGSGATATLGATSGSAIFSGAITLTSDTLDLTAPSGQVVTYSGGISGTAERAADGKAFLMPQRALTRSELRDAIFSTPYEKMPYAAYWERLESAYQIGALPSKAAREAHLAEIRALIAEWQAASERVQRYESSQIPIAREQSRAALSDYRGGKADLESTLGARRAEVEVRLSQVQAMGEMARAWAQLNFLLPAMPVEEHP